MKESDVHYILSLIYDNIMLSHFNSDDPNMILFL